MKRYISVICIFAAVLMTACKKEAGFVVSGSFEGMKGEKLYFEQFVGEDVVCLDSVTLKKNGKFEFRHAPQPYPELYRLRVRNQFVVLAIDSMEHITVTGSLAKPVIQGSEKSVQIQELHKAYQQKSLEEYKEYARNLIFSDPRSIVAYYALLLQNKNGEYILDVNDPMDRKCYNAVATVYNAFMPEAKRTKVLYGVMEEIIRIERKMKEEAAIQEFIDSQENAFLEIELPDEKGKLQKLSQYRGKVILLDFSLVAMPHSMDYFFDLKDLYNKYHNRGLEIYQVSADADEDLWKQTAVNLPWTTVRAEYMDCFQSYNVQNLPTLFIFNRKGEVIARHYGFDGVAENIEKCLAK